MNTTALDQPTEATTKDKFQSADFHRTYARPEVRMPEKLHHPNVEQAGAHDQFSTERKHPVFFVDLPTVALSMTIGGLLPGQVTNQHRHTYETVIYVIEGEGYTQIEDRIVEWKAGDAIYIPIWAWHNHGNRSETVGARYIACENAPLLQNLGVALREERGRDL
jgi:quercetin dioxygenase-like cupin family protein